MAFQNQSTPDVKFVDWGELGEGHTEEENIVVKEGEYIEGTVTNISDNPNYGKIYRMSVDGEEREVLVKGCTKLNNEMGYGDKDNIIPVLVGDRIRIYYHGKYTTKGGTKGYDVTVAVDRDVKSKKQ